MLSLGRNRNTNSVADVTTVSLNDATASTLVPSNPDRIMCLISLDAGFGTGVDIEVFIRFWPAADDNDKKGIVLKRIVSGNDSLLQSVITMPVDNIYTGEISAIVAVGSVDIHITEY